MKKFLDICMLTPSGERKINIEAELPNKCPNCGVSHGGLPLASYAISSNSENMLFSSIYLCPCCEKFFFAEYITDKRNSLLLSVYPPHDTVTEFKDEINNLSPKFVEIYHQAEIAEQKKLTELVGIGYRKALEFLVKDYALSKKPEEAEAIKSSPLSNCIATYIDDDHIKSLARAATWLGNDETHYVRKHPDYNLDNLKAFINATVAFIQYDLCYYSASNLLNNPE